MTDLGLTIPSRNKSSQTISPAWGLISDFILMEFIFGTLRATVVGGDVETSSQ